MARTVRDSKVETRAARAKLPASSKPYWRILDEGLHVGYRKGKLSGKWILRWYTGAGKYITETIGVADDYGDSDGITVLDFREAQAKARARVTELAASANGVRIGPYTVNDALDDYFANKKEGKGRAAIYIQPYLGDRELVKLTADDIRQWLRDTAERPPMGRSGRPRKVAPPNNEDERIEQQRARQDSANRVLAILKAALNHAFYEGRVGSDGAWRRVKKFETTSKARTVSKQIGGYTASQCRSGRLPGAGKGRPTHWRSLWRSLRYGCWRLQRGSRTRYERQQQGERAASGIPYG